MPSYDLKIQSYIVDYLTEYCLPVLRDSSFLPKKDLGLTKKYTHIPVLHNELAQKGDILLVSELT